jgi:hypothetical protein
MKTKETIYEKKFNSMPDLNKKSRSYRVNQHKQGILPKVISHLQVKADEETSQKLYALYLAMKRLNSRYTVGELMREVIRFVYDFRGLFYDSYNKENPFEIDYYCKRFFDLWRTTQTPLMIFDKEQITNIDGSINILISNPLKPVYNSEDLKDSTQYHEKEFNNSLAIQYSLRKSIIDLEEAYKKFNGKVCDDTTYKTRRLK